MQLCFAQCQEIHCVQVETGNCVFQLEICKLLFSLLIMFLNAKVFIVESHFATELTVDVLLIWHSVQISSYRAQ